MVYITWSISAILAIVAGLMVLFWPKTLRIAIGIYLLFIGVLGIININ